MNCSSCELKLEEQISKTQNIKKVKANRIKWTVEVTYTDSYDEMAIKNIISENWYSIWKTSKTWLSHNVDDYINIAISIIIIEVVYLYFKQYGIQFWNVENLSASTIWVSLIIGIAAWLSTCMAVIWWLMVWISSKWAQWHSSDKISQRIKPHIYFQIWRILWFWILWGLLWLFWSIISFSSSFLWITTIIIWIIMVLLWFNLTKISPKIWELSIWLPKVLSKNIWSYGDSKISTIILWVMTFFLPCWFTLAMQWFAVSTWNFVYWGLAMMLFAIWTMPWLLSIWLLSSILKGVWLKKYLAFTGVLVLSLWWFNIFNGYWIISVMKQPVNIVNATNLETEEVRIIQDNTWYTPNKILINPWKKIKLIIESKSLYTCASQMIIPSLWIEKTLKLWENIIEFESPKSWEISFSCAMGMYKGTLVVK